MAILSPRKCSYILIGFILCTLVFHFMVPQIPRLRPTGTRIPFSPGTPKPAGQNYSRTLVVCKIMKENTDWIFQELPQLQTAIYETDNPNATEGYRVPANKGREAMAYLTHIIDHYDKLPEITIFVHAGRFAWHNNDLMNRDNVVNLRRLRNDRVVRQGYMNLSCRLDPGCPDWIRLDLAEGDVEDEDKPEQRVYTAALWRELFPLHRVPRVLSQPGGAQFAVTAERIRDNPKSTYEHLRTWLVNTTLPDHLSGRVFEYVWQYLFTREFELCPLANYCHCDGYGICFGSLNKYNAFINKRLNINNLKKHSDANNRSSTVYARIKV